MTKESPAAVLYDENGNPVAVTIDGSIYRLETYSKIKNASGTVVNPSTEDTLASIKDTDGVKKITDALPEGLNVIGRVIPSNGEGHPAVGHDEGEYPTDERVGVFIAGQEPHSGEGRGTRVARLLHVHLEGQEPLLAVKDPETNAHLLKMTALLNDIRDMLLSMGSE